MPVTRRVVDRFVPGETVDEALKAVVALRDSGRFVTVDYLGEDVTDSAAADTTVKAYRVLLGAAEQLRAEDSAGPQPFEVSLKLSALGQALPRDGEKIALENAHAICTRAREVGAWVTVDAEDHTTTDSTLSIVRELRNDFPWLGTVLQAYLKRTEADCREFAASGARIRLCKGAYDEPASVAFRDRDEVTESYLRCLRILMAGSGYPMVASHDPAIIGLSRRWCANAAAVWTISSTRCSTASATPSSDDWSGPVATCAYTSRSELSGTATSCAAWPSVPPT